MRSGGTELAGLRFVDRPRAGPALEPMRYSDAIAAVTGRWLEREGNAIVFGEEVANLGGGAYGATKGLVERFPDRLINTPISEGGFSGLGFGAAMLGMRVVVEIMFADFALVAADQLFNQLSKARHMYGDTTDLPIVVRSRVGTGLGYGAQHSMGPGRPVRDVSRLPDPHTGRRVRLYRSVQHRHALARSGRDPGAQRAVYAAFTGTGRRPGLRHSVSARRAPCRPAIRSPC